MLMATATLPAFFIHQEADYILAFDNIEINLDRNTVTRAGKQVHLTQSEQELLMHFLTNSERDLTRDSICLRPIRGPWTRTSFDSGKSWRMTRTTRGTF